MNDKAVHFRLSKLVLLSLLINSAVRSFSLHKAVVDRGESNWETVVACRKRFSRILIEQI